MAYTDLGRFVKDDVYQGPTQIYHTAVAVHISGGKSLGGLEEVHDHLSIDHTRITEAPNLRYVKGVIFSPIKYYPKLEHCKKIETHGYIPVCPLMDGKAIIETGWCPHIIEGAYECFVRSVKSTPAEELLTLRSTHPHLTHLIDYVLKGGKL